jgi:hypothetical protein
MHPTVIHPRHAPRVPHLEKDLPRDAGKEVVP